MKCVTLTHMGMCGMVRIVLYVWYGMSGTDARSALVEDFFIRAILEVFPEIQRSLEVAGDR